MPVQFLSEADHERLKRFPAELSSEDLTAYFLLSREDVSALGMLRGRSNRLGFALQLCALRYLGFSPEDVLSFPAPAIAFVAQQLGLSSADLSAYGKRLRTLQDHQRQVQEWLGYRRATPIDVLELEAWLLARAQEHDKPSLLFGMACEHLKRHKIVRIGTTRLEKMVATARAEAWRVSYENIQFLLSKENLTFMDTLLEPGDRGTTQLAWLQRLPTNNGVAQILDTLDKIAFLQDHAVNTWTVSVLNPNRVKFLAGIGARVSNQYLQRTSAERRYPILMAFLKESLYSLTDDVIEMVDQNIWRLYGDAKRTFENDRLRAARTINQKLVTLRDLGAVVFDAEVDDSAVRKAIFEHIPAEQLKTSLAETEQLIRPEDDAFVDYFARHYISLKKMAKKLLATLSFQARVADRGLLEALDLVKGLFEDVIRKVPANAATGFIPHTWLNYVLEDGGIQRRYYELATLWVLRQALRSGDVYTPHSRRFMELESYFIPREAWSQRRNEALELLGTPTRAEARLAEREQELKQLADTVETLLHQAGDLREERGQLVLAPLEADEVSPSAEELGDLVAARLPRLDLTDLLVEVDGWVNFSAAFTHLSTGQPLDQDTLLYLYASLLAQGCNLGFKQMATSANLSYHKLLWCNTWHLSDEALKDATTLMVNYHHALPLSSLWGGGMLSSSDGQRFLVKGDLRKARALPRYFGYGKGITFYTWTSDQFSQYGSKAIPSTVRDATYVLDEILNNETDLDILEHTTDTAGYTELVFALFDLLGLTFSPRIRDLKDQQLYRTEALDLTTLPKLRGYLQGTINKDVIVADWDELLRLVASLKMGYVTASLLIQKLQAYPRQHPLLRALQEYGRLPKTIHILRWYSDALKRRSLNRQINKGEALHQLRGHLNYGDHGEIREQDDVQLDHQVACLNLLTNAIILWNTVYFQKVFEQLRQEGHKVDSEDVKHIWPMRYAHINIYGRYHFDVEAIGKKLALRPLQPAKSKP